MSRMRSAGSISNARSPPPGPLMRWVGRSTLNGAAGERCVSTTNRDFEGRQGKGVRTHLVSPATAAATAIAGRIVDVRQLVRGAA